MATERCVMNQRSQGRESWCKDVPRAYKINTVTADFKVPSRCGVLNSREDSSKILN
jgi:hypothetical protein